MPAVAPSPPKVSPKSAGECRWDCLALGEVMLRFDPGEDRIRTARSFRVWEGGGEYNVARSLRRTFGWRTAIATALPRTELGALAEDLILQGGVDMSPVVWREADAIGRDSRMGLNFTERGFGVRSALGCSDRANSAASQLAPGEIDWDTLFGRDGVRWLHTGGVFTALSSSTAAITLEAVKAARRHGTRVSFDLNYRPSLWTSHGDPETLRRVNREIVSNCDVLFGDELAIAGCLGEANAPVARETPTDRRPFDHSVDQLIARYPQLSVVATTLRDPVTATRNGWGGLIREGDVRHASHYIEDLEILDRVGGGDAFAAGVVHALLSGFGAQVAVDWGTAHGALAMTTPGDTAVSSIGEIIRFLGPNAAATVR
ncbi:sugar kinase [uncultured Brevundimonas sp.]|uniref:sugar kinase n=1 Tax=uncultured Brevundimonas sp. TaxID=213418 RepID=UPI0030EE91B0|tara:strand:- start:2756 stop:3874 length:1119 start_codon:yes stop_codon:yes gene_type:complete